MNVIVLEHPRIRSDAHFNDIANTPLWSCLLAGYAAASLEQAGCDVALLDANRLGWDFERTCRQIVRQSPRLLCVHSVYFWEHSHQLLSFFKDLRTSGYDGHLNLFGFFPTLAYDLLLNACPGVDSIAVGECEWTLARLARQIDKGQPWHGIPGLAHRNGEAVHFPQPRASEPDPDRFPMPWRQDIPGQTVSILASRGCYNHCGFCPVPSFYNDGPKWRGRQSQQVALEIGRLMKRGATDFYFVDPNFVGPGAAGKRRTGELCRRLAPLEINFGMETRADDLDADLLDALCSAGLRSLLLGIESGSTRILNSLQKHSSSAAAETAIGLCRGAGIEPEVGFLMFVPDSTLADLEENIAFLKRNRLLDRLDRTANLLSHRQIVFRGTPGHRRFVEQGRICGADPLGFETRITWADPAVSRMADIIGHACLLVIRQTGVPESPLYWKKNSNWKSHSAVNDYLVMLFDKLLAQTRRQKQSRPTQQMKAIVASDLMAIIGPSSERH